MIEVAVWRILTTLEEKLDPAHAAVVNVDMQKDFTAKGFWWDDLGQLETDLVRTCSSEWWASWPPDVRSGWRSSI